MLIVQNDTGDMEGANSYTSMEEAEDILVIYGFTEFPSEVDLIMATKYVDTYLTPVKSVLNKEQTTMFPRQKFKDSQGRDVTGISKELKEVTALLATEFQENDLWNEEPAILEEAFGDSRVRYSGPARQNRKPSTYINRLIMLGYGTSTSQITLVRA